MKPVTSHGGGTGLSRGSRERKGSLSVVRTLCPFRRTFHQFFGFTLGHAELHRKGKVNSVLGPSVLESSSELYFLTSKDVNLLTFISYLLFTTLAFNC